MEQYEEIIRQIFRQKIKKIKMISQSNNVVYRVNTDEYGEVYAKFYLSQSHHIDHEMKLYNFVNPKYLKKVIYRTETPNLSIFQKVQGKTVDELTKEELNQYQETIINSLIAFYDELACIQPKGYGELDDYLNGRYTNFHDFIIERQRDTQEVLKDYDFLNTIFDRIYHKYHKILLEDNRLVEIDMNLKNIMITPEGEVVFIDPGELISAPILMGYGDFVAHTYRTPLFSCLMERLKLKEEEEKRLRIYAIFSSLNILAFLKLHGVDDLKGIIPYGNTYTFYELIKEHMEFLDLGTSIKSLRHRDTH